MKFTKMHGLGNDFVVLEGPVEMSEQSVRDLCDRRRGVGGDGVLIVEQIDRSRVRMSYWNADGSAAELCGNGLRCVARYALDEGWVDGPAFVVETAVGPLEVEVGDEVKAQLGEPIVAPEAETVSGHRLRRASVGNPHAVIFVDDVANAPVTNAGPALEGAFPNGANVEFVSVVGEDTIAVRVWERGVGETLACGTGALAAAAVARVEELVGDRVVVRLPGGDLTVDLRPELPLIIGPADYVYRGQLSDAGAQD